MDDTVVVQRGLFKSLFRMAIRGRDEARIARQKATIAEENLDLIVRQMIHAGVAPDSDEEGERQ